jgi:hypothetical protein
MWDAQRTRQWDLYLRSGAVVIAAFVVTGLIFVALQKAMGTANQRLTNRFNRASETEATRRAQTPAYSPGSPFAANAPNSATGMPSAYAANATPGLPPTQPLSGVTIPSVPASVNTAFPVEADRRNAQLAVRPFKDALTSVRQYDTSALWSDIPTASGTTPGTVVNALIPPVRSDAETSGRRPKLDPAAERQQAIQKIINQADALAAELSLVSHPERYPQVLRDLIGESAKEARIYLSTVQYAAIHPEERARLRTLAHKHLSRSEALLAQVEQMTGGTTGGTAGF